MKKCVFLLCVTAFDFSLSAQDSAQMRLNEHNYNQFLLEKSKKQEKAGWVVFGTGVAVCVIGFLIPKGEYSESGSNSWGLGRAHTNTELKTTVFLGGLTFIGTSFILFGRSSMTKRQAVTAY